jgi:HK97 gp10 family phage protein
MSIRVTAKIEGGEQLLRALKEMDADLDRVLEAAALEGAEVIREAAISRAPGDHIEVEVKEVKRGHATIEIGPDKDHWYYKFFETGTSAHEVRPVNRKALQITPEAYAMFASPSGMAARPFLRPAFDEKQAAAEAAVGDKLREAVEK